MSAILDVNNHFKMKLATKCKSCGSEIIIRIWATDRSDLARTKEEYLEQICKNCGTKANYHVDCFSAQPSKLATIIALSVFMVGTPLILIFIWEPLWILSSTYTILAIAGLLLIPVTIYGIIQKEEMRKVSLFNRYKLKGTGRN